MADFKTRTIVEARAEISFGEGELRALDAMIGYGADAFLKVFYPHLGEAYMQKYEDDFRALFATLGMPVRQALMAADQARQDIREAGKARFIRAQQKEAAP